MNQLSLVADPVVAAPPGVDMIRGDASDAIARARDLGGARLVFADPPWDGYDPGSGGVQGNGSLNARPQSHFPCLGLDGICTHIDAALDAATPDAHLVLWHCWPLVAEAIAILRSGKGGETALDVAGRWVEKTGGSWNKSAASLGVGFHWLGHSEPVIVYVTGRAPAYRDTSVTTRSGHTSEPGEHSAKPEGWTEAMIRRWTEPGDVVLDLYAGMGGVARACVRSGRRYVGAEIDVERHAQALGYIVAGRVLA